MGESKVYKRYQNLYDACHRNPKIQLYSNGKATFIYFDEKEFVNEHPQNGFYEKFGLSDEERVKVKIYRAQIKK